MKLFKYSIIFIVFIGLACQDVDHMSKPKNLIPENKMVNVLTEMALINAARNYNKVMLEQTGIKPDQYIYDKFGIDSIQFEKSNAYYTENYDDYERVFDKVKDSLQSLKTYIDEVVAEEKRVEDSIKKAKREKDRPEFKKQVDSTEVDSTVIDSISIEGEKILDSLKQNEQRVMESLQSEN